MISVPCGIMCAFGTDQFDNSSVIFDDSFPCTGEPVWSPKTKSKYKKGVFPVKDAFFANIYLLKESMVFVLRQKPFDFFLPA